MSSVYRLFFHKGSSSQFFGKPIAWVSQQGMQVGTEPVIADIADIMLCPLGILNAQTPVFQQADNFNGICIGLVKLNAHGLKNKTTPDLSIVERLGGSGAANVRQLFHTTKLLRFFFQYRRLGWFDRRNLMACVIRV